MEHLSSYPNIYALGHRAIADLFQTEVVIEEKIDGSQFSMSRVNGELLCRSKGKDLIIDAPEKMFIHAVCTAKSLDLVDGWTYRCEYLQSPKHNTLAYSRVPTKHIIVFDIMVGPEQYLSPAEKLAECQRLGLECVPLYFQGVTIDPRHGGTWLNEMLDRESVLGGCKVEGVVVKNYSLFTQDKKVAIGKYVSAAFKEKHLKDWKNSNPSPTDVVTGLIGELRTEARWNKAIQHLRDNGELLGEPKDIGPLVRELQADTMKEEADYVKEKLFNHFWPQIQRGVTAGFPEFYKSKLGLVKVD